MGRLTFLERREIQNIAYAIWLLVAFFKYVAIPVWFGCTLKVWLDPEIPTELQGWLNGANMMVLTCYACLHSLRAIFIIPGFFLCNSFIRRKMDESFDKYYPEYTV